MSHVHFVAAKSYRNRVIQLGEKPQNVFLVNDEIQLAKFVKQNIYGKKIVIGMGAGSISNWIRNLPKLI